MTPERWARLKALFSVAVDRGPDVDPEGLLALCGEDSALSRDLAALVREHFSLSSTEVFDQGHDPVEVSALVPPNIPPYAQRRFRFLARVGFGSFGDVYKVFDEQRSATVALKVLRETKPSSLMYFKREFRSLAGIEHPNLVRLHELISNESRWMFTMEFLEGSDFLRHIGIAPGIAADPLSVREHRIRAALPQLASALAALHQQGLLHRDLKPSNVMVTDAGRLCLLDFGLIRAFAEGAFRKLTIAGTPDYMSPEQAAGTPLGEASDWYAVGVMLYQALTGALPFKGDPFDVLRRKQLDSPLPPRDLEPGISPDLNRFCLGLLNPDTAQRMRVAETVHELSSAGPSAPAGVRVPPHKSVVLGRDGELKSLHDAYSRSVDGCAVAVHVYGRSGVGKTLLIREFLNQLRADDPSVVVFAGRCYQSESVPYQGLDDLIDSMAQYLRGLPTDELRQILPRNFPLVVRMFPVLGQLPWIEHRAAVPLDAAELRARAFLAVRDLLGRIADRHRLVLAIDDLQWSDLDTCAFLRELTSSLEAPPLLLVLSYRTEDIEALSWLRLLHTSAGENKAFADHTLLNLSCLSEENTAHLAELLAAGAGVDLGERGTRTVVEQSGGDPFLVHEIVRWVQENREGDVGADRFKVETALKSRFDVLLPDERHMLELVAVTGQPLPVEVLKQLIAQPELVIARDRLVVQRLLRYRSVEGRDEVEVYHDRIRTAVLRFLEPEELRLRHAALANALERTRMADPEQMARHFYEAGQRDPAAANARIAAARALEALAFNKAARFFQLALQAGFFERAERAALYRDLGDALSSAGRGAEAAEAFLNASIESAGVERLRSLGLAAGQFLRCGYIRRGRQLLREVLSQAGMHSPLNRRLQLLLVVLLRLRIRVRGLRYRERSASELPPEQLLHLDLCASAALGLSMTDPLSSAEFSSRFVLRALQAGEPYRAALALAGEATQVCHGGGMTRFARARALLERAAAIANRIANPHAAAYVTLMGAVVSYLEGDWKRCCEECEKTIEMLRSNCNGISWELSTANTFAFVARSIRGEWSENRSRLPGLVREAETRGDLYASISLRILGCVYILDLGAAQPERAQRGLADDLEAWPTDQYDLQRANGLLGKIDISLYRREPQEGWAHLEQEWPLLERSGMMALSTTFTFSHCCRGRVALAMAMQAVDSDAAAGPFLRVARKSARAILDHSPPWGKGLAHLLLAGVATFESPERIRAELQTAADLLEQGGLAPFQIAAAYRLAQFMPEVQSAALSRVVEEWTSRQEIADPPRIFEGLTPGRWSTKS